MSAALARAGQPGQDLLAGYAGHVRTLGLSDRAVRDRLRIARDFLGRHPSLQEWMASPVTDRVTELARTGAWPLICHAIGAGRLRLDLEFAGPRTWPGSPGPSRHETLKRSPPPVRQESAWAGRPRGRRPSSASAWRSCSPGTAAAPPT